MIFSYFAKSPHTMEVCCKNKEVYIMDVYRILDIDDMIYGDCEWQPSEK